MLARWIADYDDPDNFTFTLFHSGNGRLRNYFSSPETDRSLEEARRESRPATREALYRKVREPRCSTPRPSSRSSTTWTTASDARACAASSFAVPRPTSTTRSSARRTRRRRRASPDRPAGGGVLHVPIAGVVRSLDPSLTVTVEQADVLPSVFETLTWAVEGTRVVPWLASEVVPENDGMRFRFRLRAGVRFHNGRRLTARDVRHSYERLLANRQSESRWFLSPVRGAKRMLDGEATDLDGFRIVSPSEFVIELENPVPFFPALISYAATAIVPEGTGSIGSTAREGAVGTGPFRVVGFEPGRRLELERNPHYWRAGYPKSEGIVFRCRHHPRGDPQRLPRGPALARIGSPSGRRRGVPARRAFRLRVPRDPAPSDLLRRLQRRRGPFDDGACAAVSSRRSMSPALVRRTLGRLAIPAHGLIPPGLLGYSAAGPSSGSRGPARAAHPTAPRGDRLPRVRRAHRRDPPGLLRRVRGLLPRARRGVSRDRLRDPSPTTRRWPST